MRGRWSDRKDRVLDAIQENPYATMNELVEATGIKCKSNIWYHLHDLHMKSANIGKGVTLANVIQRLKDESAAAKAEGARRHVPGKKRATSRTSLMSRIDEVVEKARQEQPVMGQRIRLVVQWDGDRWASEAR